MAILPDGTGPGRSVIVALWALAVVWALSTHPVWKVAIWVFSTLVLWVVFWWGYPRASYDCRQLGVGDDAVARGAEGGVGGGGMIRRSTRYLTPAERAANQWRIPFTSWAIPIPGEKERLVQTYKGLVEILEFSVEKAWCVWGCDHGWGCCPSCLLLRTPNKEFICLGGTVSSSPAYEFRWGSSRCDGDHVMIERWPNKQIYSVRFSGAPVKHVDLPWEARRVGPLVEREMARLLGLWGCHVVDVDSANDLPEDDLDAAEDEH